jgi:hypothetical protein
MRKTILRRLEVLEKDYHSRKQRELSSLREARWYVWKVILGYYLGDLRSDESDPFEAETRALKYASEHDHLEVFLKVRRDKDIGAMSEVIERYNDAYRRLFSKVGLDFDKTPPNILFDAVVTMVNQLPEQWLNWLRSNLQEWCGHAEIAAGSNLPRRLSADNVFPFRRPIP